MSDYTQVLPRVFIGNAAAARDVQFFNRYKINFVINVTESELNYFESEINNKKLIRIEDACVKYLSLAVSDTCSTNLSIYFPQTNQFIKNCLYSDKNALLVHCKCGVSRSSSILLAYLISVQQMTLSNALKLIKKERRRIRPNIGFFLQLLQLEKDVFENTDGNEIVMWKPSISPHVYCEMPEETWVLMMKVASPNELPTQINEKQYKLLSKLAFRGRKKRRTRK